MKDTIPRIVGTPEQARSIDNWAAAANAEAEIYEGYCAEHGWTKFSVDTRKCSLCKKTPGRRYSNSASEYIAVCPAHGDMLHDVATGRCLLCTVAVGRPPSDRPRAVARRAGQTAYIDRCETHGETAHHVSNGKCAACFTSAGTRRIGAGGRPTSDEPRAAARRAGKTTFVGSCAVHGPVQCAVRHGRCLKCFTVLGTPRAAVRSYDV